jgi:hypothetical protein
MANAIADEIQKQIDNAAKKGVAVLPKTILFSAAMGGIQNERARAVDALDKLGRRAAEVMHKSGAVEQAARMAGEHAAGDVAAAEKQLHTVVARTLLAAMLEIERDPNACRACGGTKYVESRLAPGTRVSCEACAPVTEPSQTTPG